jgi:hypothetical protein
MGVLEQVHFWKAQVEEQHVGLELGMKIVHVLAF